MNIFLQQKTYHSINQLIIVLIIHQSINQLKVQSFKIHLSLNTLSVSISNSYSISPVAVFKEFERRFKFKPRFKYGWFYLKLYQMFQDLSRRFI